MSNNYTRKNSQASKQQTENNNNTQGPKIATVQSETETSQTKNKMGFSHTVKAKQPGPPPGFEKNNRRSSTGPSNPSTGIWNGNSLANGWEHNNGDSGLLAGGRRSMGGNGYGKYNGFQNASSAIRPQQTTKIGPHATFKSSKKPIQIDTSGSLLQSSVSMFVPGMDSEWAKSHRNKFLKSEFSSVMTGINNAKLENGRLTGTFEYLEKEATSSKNLPYMQEFVPLDIEEHKVNLFLKKSDSKNSSIDSSRSNSRTESKTDHKNDHKSENNATKNGGCGGTSGATSGSTGTSGSTSANKPTGTGNTGNTKNSSNQSKGSKNSKSTTSNNSSRPRGRH